MIRKLASVILIMLLLFSDCRLLFIPYIVALLVILWVPSPSVKVWRHALVYLSLTIPFFIERPQFSVNFLEIALNVVLGLSLISFYYRDIKVMFSPIVRDLFPRISSATFFYKAGFIYSSAVIEEVFFKGFMLQKLFFFGVMSVPIVSFLFVFLHWVNPIQMGKREWTVLSTMALGSGLLFYFTSSIVGCILCHCIYSTPSVMSLYLQRENKRTAGNSSRKIKMEKTKKRN